MTTWNRTQGDIGDTITITLDGVDDLNNVASVECHVTKGTTTATLAAAVANPVARTVLVQLGTVAQLLTGWLAGAQPGTWSLETEVTFADGTVLTWPDLNTDYIAVRPQIA